MYMAGAYRDQKRDAEKDRLELLLQTVVSHHVVLRTGSSGRAARTTLNH